MAGITTDEQRIGNFDHFGGAITEHLGALPPYFKDIITRYTDAIGRLKIVSGQTSLSKVDISGAISTHADWRERILKTAKSVYFDVKAKNEDKLELYFAGFTPSKLKTDSDIFKVVDNMITMSAHPDTPELKPYSEILKQLRAEGSKIIGSRGNLKEGKHTGTLELTKVRKNCDEQYQKLKYLMRGYFYNSGVDYSTLFKDMESKPGKHTGKTDDKETPEKPADINLKPQKPVDRIKTGTVLVPPPVISPEKKIP